MAKQVSFWGSDDPELVRKNARLQRQQAIAAALAQGSQSPDTSNWNSMRVVPAMGWGQGLTQLASAWLGKKAEDRAEKTAGELETERSKRLADAMAAFEAQPTQGEQKNEQGVSVSRLAAAQKLVQLGADPQLIGKMLDAQIEREKKTTFQKELGDLPEDQRRTAISNRLLGKPEATDLDDRVILRDSSGNVLKEYEKGLSPGALLSAETTIRGQDMGAATARRGQDITMRGQDMTSATAQAKLDAKQAEKDEMKAKQARSQVSTADRVIGVVDEALGLANWRTTGGVGAATRSLPGGGAGSDAYDLSKAVDTIKANLSFQELQRMRAESPTGGALGSITERELDLLGSTVANLDPNQDDDTLRANLAKVKQHMENIKELQAAGAVQQGQPQNPLDAAMQQYGGGTQ